MSENAKDFERAIETLRAIVRDHRRYVLDTMQAEALLAALYCDCGQRLGRGFCKTCDRDE